MPATPHHNRVRVGSLLRLLLGQERLDDKTAGQSRSLVLAIPAIVGLIIFLSPGNLTAKPEIHWAGFSFAGDAAAVSEAYPHSYAVYAKEQDAATHESLLELRLREAVQAAAPASFDFILGKQIRLKKGDGLAMSCALDGELVFVDRLSDCYAISIWLSAQILVFDFSNRNLVACFPVGVILRTTSNAAPDDKFLQTCIRRMLLEPDGADNISLVAEFSRRVQTLSIRDSYPVRLQLRHVDFSDKALAKMPAEVTRNEHAITMLKYFIGNSFNKALSSRAQIPTLPFILGRPEVASGDTRAINAGGSMAILMGTVSDGNVYNLTIPEADYVFDLKVDGFAKAKVSEKPGIQKWVYAAYVDTKMLISPNGTVFLSKQFINPWYEDVPLGSELDDWGVYRSSLYELMSRIGESVSDNPNREWLSAQNEAESLVGQLKVVRTKLAQCR